MSQPANNQYRMYDQSGSSKGAIPVAMANGEPGITRQTQNGVQPTSLDSAGTPSSQSSHDPSRETSRDPSPTQYLNARYRPQLSRPPMPPMNGQQSPLTRAPMTQQPRLNQPPRGNPSVNPQNSSDQFSAAGASSSAVYHPATKVPTSEPQIGGSMQGQKPTAPATHELSSPERRFLEKANPEITSEERAIQPPFSQYGKNSTAIAADPSALERTNVGGRWTNSSIESNCNDRQSFGVQSGVGANVWSKDATTSSTVDSKDARPPTQSHTFQQSWNAPPTSRAQPGYLPYPQTSTAVPAINTNMQNVFSNPSSNENRPNNQMALIRQQQQQPQPQPQPPPLKPPTLYGPPSDHQPTPYGGQQPNATGQWNYGHAGYPTQYPTGGTMTISQPPPLQQQTSPPYEHRPPYFGQMSNVPLDNMNRRYPNAAYPDKINEMDAQMGNLNVTQRGFNEMWGQQSIDLLQCRNVLPGDKIEPPRIKLHQEFLDNVNCSPDIFRCTLTKIPETNSLLQKCRLPLGVLIHPFKDLNHLPVIQCSTIVRCRACRTYINPFVYFVDSKRWKCNLCYRVNELPEEFQFDPVTKSYGDPSRRPEVKTSTIEFIAPSEYMLRPPQPAVYLFILDVSRLAVDSGYLEVVCRIIGQHLDKLPGDGRTQVGFIAIDSAIHFFGMPESVSQPHEMIMLDVDDVFLPCPDNLIVNLKEREELVRDLLEQLPSKFADSQDTNSALGAGLQAAFKLMSATGGRVTVFQTCLPNVGPGALQPREDPNARAGKDAPHLNPATDFYKRLALDCSGQQIAVDLFLLNSQYSDLATLSGMCKFSGGSIYHIPLFRRNKPQQTETLENMLRRYLTRKIGFEAVMRIRCTRGLSIHTFHGNFFVRSTDLLSLPNVNPDAGFGMQVSIEENLADVQSVCFQAALLYTSSKGERRIRVHTLCLPVSSSMSDILHSADQQAIIGLLSKMAVDRSQQSSLTDARDALINVAIDVLSAHKLSLPSSSGGGLMAPANLKLLPLYIVALMKSVSFRTGTSTRLDDRVYAMCQMKALPLSQLMLHVYPDLYPVHALDDRNCRDIDGKACPRAPRLHLSAEKLDFRGVFLMDAGDRLFIYVGKSVDPAFCNNVLGVPAYSSIPEQLYDLPELQTAESERLRNFVFSLQEEKPYYAPLQIMRDDSHSRSLFTDRLVEDRFENALSYYEFLQHLKTQVK